jgi:hypothetical protein
MQRVQELRLLRRSSVSLAATWHPPRMLDTSAGRSSRLFGAQIH